MRLLRRLAGPWGRRLLLAFAVTAAWAGWMIAPPRPLREWGMASLEPTDWLLTPARTGLACITCRDGRFPDDPVPSRYGPMQLWDLATGRERVTTGPVQPANVPVTLRVAPDGTWVLITRRLNWLAELTLQLWDAETGRERCSVPILNHFWGDLPASHVVSPDGRFVAYHRNGGAGEVLLTATGHVHFTLGSARPLVFTPDSQALAAANADTDANKPTTITFWDMASGRPRSQLVLKHYAPVATTFSRDGRWLAVCLLVKSNAWSTPYVVELWDLRIGEQVAELALDSTHNAGSYGLEFSPDGAMLVASSSLGLQRVWDVTQSPPQAIDIPGQFPDPDLSSVLPFRHSQALEPTYPIFAPDGARFVGPTPAGDTLVFRETAHPDRAVIARRSVQPIDRPDFAPNGRSLAVLHMTLLVDYWQRAADWLYRTVGQAPTIGRPLAIDVAEEERSELVVFDATTGAVAGRIANFATGTHLIGFGPTGRTVWTMTHTPAADGAGTLRVQEWAVPTGWPPAWLLAATALGVLLAVADWRRTRRPAPGGPTP